MKPAVFVLGSIFLTTVGRVLVEQRTLLMRVGGVVVILMGLVFLGVGAQREARLSWRPRAGLIGAPVLGAVFALGWTPCLGPTLTGVIAVASATEGANVARGVALVVAYCLGLGVPFLLLALGSGWAIAHQMLVPWISALCATSRYRAPLSR